MVQQTSRRILVASLAVVVVTIFIGAPFITVAQEEATPTPTPAAKKTSLSEEQIKAKEKEIAEIDRKIKELQSQKSKTDSEAAAVAGQVAALQQQLTKSELELQQTNLAIQKVEVQQSNTKSEIESLHQQMAEKKAELRFLIRSLYEHEQEHVIRIFFDENSLSDMLAQRAAYEELQARAIKVVQEMRAEQAQLEKQQQKLVAEEAELGQLEKLLVVKKAEISEQKEVQRTVLEEKQEEQSEYAALIREAQNAREEIKKQIFTLKGSGVEVSLNNAFDMARYASKLTGVRPALLLGVLKVESDVGGNIGSGKFPDDMHPQHRDAFLRVTKKLGLDPYTAQISRRPNSRWWGGAMGPAQIMPGTWEGLEPRLLQITKKPQVNPYDLADAFVATAIFLADRGATSPAGEREAVGRYVAGPNWQYHSWYIDRVMAVVKEYEQSGV